MDSVIAARARFLTNGKGADHRVPTAPSRFEIVHRLRRSCSGAFLNELKNAFRKSGLNLLKNACTKSGLNLLKSP